MAKLQNYTRKRINVSYQHHFIVASKLIQFTQSIDPPVGPAVLMARIVSPAVLTRLVSLVPVFEDAAVVAVPVGFPAI